MPEPIERRVEDSSSFLERVLHWLAVLCIALGVLRVVNLSVFQGLYLRLWSGYHFGFYGRFEIGFRVSMVVAALLLFIGGVGLMRRRRWGRTLLLVWIVVDIVGLFGTNMVLIFEYSRRLAATTRPVGLSLQYLTWIQLANVLEHCAFPLLVLMILLQPHVRHLWARSPGGGFEVIPLAKAAVANPETEA